jgi:hypothetical protein
MQKITVALPEELILLLETMAVSNFNAKLNPGGTRIELSTTIRTLLDFAVRNYDDYKPSIKTLGRLWDKFEAKQIELANLKSTVNQICCHINFEPTVGNKSIFLVKHNEITNQPVSFETLIVGGLVEFSQESICHRFGWDISNENVQNNFKNLRQYANLEGIGEYSGWVVVSDNGNYRYFFTEY